MDWELVVRQALFAPIREKPRTSGLSAADEEWMPTANANAAAVTLRKNNRFSWEEDGGVQVLENG